MWFPIVGQIVDIQTIAIGRSIRNLKRLRRTYGVGRWRKLKGVASIQLEDGRIVTGEVHWYEAHGLGRREMKVKNLFD